MNSFQANDIEILVDLLAEGSRGCVAVGEIGLDALIDIPFELQLKVFERQLEIAQHFSLPIIVHQRKTHHHLLRL